MLVLLGDSCSRESLRRKERKFDPSSTLEMVGKWGPSTRTIVSLADGSNTEASLEAQARSAADHICSNLSFIVALSDPGSISTSEGSDLVFIRPHRQYMQNGDIKSSATCYPFIPTGFLAELFEKSRMKISNDASLALFETLSTHSLTKGAVGWAHEMRVHRRLCSVTKGSLPIFRDDHTQSMSPSSNLLSGTESGLKHPDVLDSSFYWMPSVINFPGIDSVLGDTDQNIYAVQATVADKHKSPVEGLQKIWNKLEPDARTHRSWHFVLVTDNRTTAEKLMKDWSDLKHFEVGHPKVEIPLSVWGCVVRG